MIEGNDLLCFHCNEVLSIRVEFDSFRLNERGRMCAFEIAVQFTHLLNDLEERFCESGPAPNPAGAREMAIVRTKLQEAKFWAVRAMSMRPENQDYGSPPGPKNPPTDPGKGHAA